MIAQVLVIGNSGFVDLLSKRIRGLDTFSLELAGSVKQAEAAMLASPPDLVIAQAAPFESLSVFKRFRQHRRLLGVYFVLIEDRAEEVLAGRERIVKHLDKSVKTLEVGVDAYLWLWQGKTSEHSHLIDRLLQAQVRHGLQRAQAYRDLARTNDWLSTIALVDALTQLNNRRAFDLALPAQIQKSRAQNTPFCLMVLDIDFFKQINDAHGHLIGDDVLKGLAQRLRNNMRFYDTPYRYGGEEFVILLSNTDVDEGMLIGHRIRELIAEKPFEVGPNLSLSISVSIGIAFLCETDDERGLSLLNRADQNLLRAKGQGRNRVVVT